MGSMRCRKKVQKRDKKFLHWSIKFAMITSTKVSKEWKHSFGAFLRCRCIFNEGRLENECRRYWFYADLCSTGVFYDTGSGVLLWRSGQKKKCGKYDDGMCGNHGIVRCYVGSVWLFTFVWGQSCRNYR